MKYVVSAKYHSYCLALFSLVARWLLCYPASEGNLIGFSAKLKEQVSGMDTSV